MTDESAGSEPRPTFLVTGATSGIGEAIAMQLSERGARVLMGARTPERGRVAADRVRTRAPDADLQVAAADLSLMQEVRSLAYQIKDSTPRLDGLFLNAAEAHSDLVLLSDQQALEHLVRPGTREAPAAHGHHRHAADPGFVRTNLGRYATGRRRLLLSVTRPMQSSSEKAAITPVYLATSSEVAGVTGRYYTEGHPKELSGLAANAKLARRLWAVSAQALVTRGLATLNEMIAFG